jgi:hypothetical protein
LDKIEKETIMKNSEKLKESFLRLSGALLSLAMLGASLGPANGALLQVNANAPYMCVTAQNADTANNTPVVMSSCSAAPEQEWYYVDGQFEGIGTANGVATCLDVKGNGTTPGTLVDLFQCNGQQNQQWKIDNGEIVGKQSGLCLDSSGGPTVSGATQLIIDTCSGLASQDWIVRQMQFDLNAPAPHTCIAVEGANSANATPVISYSCSGGPGQIFEFGTNEIQVIGIGTSKCLTPIGAVAGSLVEIYPCAGKPIQEWVIETGEDIGISGSTVNQIVNYATGLCLDASGGPSTGGGTQFVTNTCTAATSQNWLVH